MIHLVRNLNNTSHDKESMLETTFHNPKIKANYSDLAMSRNKLKEI
jgi:hypothetical protein